jgi:hypothetical protein
VAWSKLIGFPEHLDLATCEIDTFRCPVSDRTVASVTSVQHRSNTRR